MVRCGVVMMAIQGKTVGDATTRRWNASISDS
jgi:hypothetical protein